MTAGIVVALTVIARLVHLFAAALYGAAAGILYGFMAALMKDITATVTEDGLAAVFAEWQLYVLAVAGVGAIVLQQLALRSGHLSAGLSAISVGTPVMSTILGITIFEETFTTEGVAWFAYGAGVTLALAGVVVLGLARSSSSRRPCRSTRLARVVPTVDAARRHVRLGR